MRAQILPFAATSKEEHGVSLRPFPYPYRAALALCSDIDDATPALFSAVHRLLSLEEESEHGPGLGLEVADSLFVWANDPDLLGLLDKNDRPTPQAEALAELCRSGWIDSLHALGDFNDGPALTRKRAESAWSTLERMGIKLKTWINHGNENNSQNLYARLGPTFAGDVPSSSAYHADLAIEHGIRYHWWHELASLPLSSERPGTLPLLGARLANSAKNALKRLGGRAWKARDSATLEHLALPVRLRDGNRVWAFTRYNSNPGGIWARPGRHSFRHQLSRAFLDRLVDWGGFAIVYTHFGQPRWDGNMPLFDPPDLEALQRLRASQAAGKILVVTTTRLLDFWTAVRTLEWRVEDDGKGPLRIRIEGINDPVAGKRRPTAEELMGIAFNAPPGRDAQVILAGCVIQDFEAFGPDADGRGGVHIPWRKLDRPDSRFTL